VRVLRSPGHRDRRAVRRRGPPPGDAKPGTCRFRRDGQTSEQDDAFTDETIEKINATGEAFFSGTTWRGRRAMRVSVSNWRTSDDDVNKAVASVARVLGAIRG